MEINQMENVFNRLHSASTVASRNRKINKICKTKIDGGDQLKTEGGCMNHRNREHSKSNPVAQHVPIPLTSIINILKSSSERPQDFYPWSCYCSSTVASIQAFKEGTLSKSKLAYVIIDDLFENDFKYNSRRKWDIDCATIVQDKENEAMFSVMKEATYNRKDIYAVASTKAVIHFLTDEIRIVGHYYYVAG